MKKGAPGRSPLGWLVACTAAVHSRVAAYSCNSVALSPSFLREYFRGRE